MNIVDMIKTYVGCATKTCEFTEVLLADDTVVINAADTTLSIIPVGFSTGMMIGFSFNSVYEEGWTYEKLTNNYLIYNKLINLWNIYESMSSNLPIEAYIENLREDNNFEDLIAMKASDGGGFYKIAGNELYQNYLLPVFTGLPSLSKQDKAGIVVKRIDRTTLLMEYHIYKKKINKEFTLFFRTVDMNRSLLEERFIV